MSSRDIIVLNLSPDLQERVLVALRPHHGTIHIIEDTEAMKFARELRSVHTAPTLPPPSELDALRFLDEPDLLLDVKTPLSSIHDPDHPWLSESWLARFNPDEGPSEPLRYKTILAIVAVMKAATRRKKT